MSNELVENVARALYAIEWGELGGPYDEQDEIDKTYWMRGATAAVNLVLEAAAERVKRRRETIERVMDVHGEDEDTLNVQAYAAHHLREIEAEFSALKGESK